MSDQPQDNKQSQSDFARRLGVFAWICVAIIFLWSLSWLFIDASIVSDELRGQFGDKFGAINSLFSGLAFATLIYALFLQMEELRLQRKELELTRNEMRGQKEEFSEQNKTLKQQQFENTFFQMLSVKHEVLDGIKVNYITLSAGASIESKTRTRVGREVVRDVLVDIEESCRVKGGGYLDKSGFLKAIGKYLPGRAGSFDNYIRFIYSFYRFLDESNVADKKFYSDIFETQMSNTEIELLFCAGLTQMGCDLGRYIEKYSLLRNLSCKSDGYLTAYLDMYMPQAYGGVYPSAVDNY